MRLHTLAFPQDLDFANSEGLRLDRLCRNNLLAEVHPVVASPTSTCLPSAGPGPHQHEGPCCHFTYLHMHASCMQDLDFANAEGLRLDKLR